MPFQGMERTKAMTTHGMHALWQEVIGPIRGRTEE
jgi:hypothetical protein